MFDISTGIPIPPEINFSPEVQCCMCGVTIQANDPGLADWYVCRLMGDPTIYYACPDEIKGETVPELMVGYLLFLRVVIDKTLAIRRPYRV